MSQKASQPLNLSLRRFLIDLNLQLDSLKLWIEVHGRRDYFTTLKPERVKTTAAPQILIDILILEDRRFFGHRGFELRSLPRGLKRRIKHGRFGGVSTIDQLLVRTHRKRQERTIGRKSSEIFMAWLCNFHCSKTDILLAFVNCAYYGPRLNGADTASKVLLNRHACDLDRRESAFIASLLPYPAPKQVSLHARRNGPFSSPDEIIKIFSASNPWWCERITARMRYVEELRIKYATTVLPKTKYL